MRKINKKGQVWVETVLYTLIGLAIIGLVLAVAKPKIEAKKDEVIIEQAIESLGNINDKITAVINEGVGNRRSIGLQIGKGKILINSTEDTISWILNEVSFEYSEKDTNVPVGGINVTTIEADPWKVTLSVGYGVEIIYADGEVAEKEIDSAPTPYNIIIENKGINITTNKLMINLREA